VFEERLLNRDTHERCWTLDTSRCSGALSLLGYPYLELDWYVGDNLLHLDGVL
jgi:hypothetical protein